MGPMTRPSILFYLLACLISLACASPIASEEAQVARVVDGDTLMVEIAGRLETIRLIGVDTPETVHPNRPVERFGKEASAFTRRLADGKTVRLEPDPENADRDKYGRLLRYVFLPDGTLLNATIVARGFGHAYTRFPFSRMEEFRALEREARQAGLGLWGPHEEPVAIADGAMTVYVTRAGKRYHNEGCRHLARSAIATTLERAARSHRPCTTCGAPQLNTGE
jgi:micrococcal nuclease